MQLTILLLFEGDADLSQEVMRRLADDHGGEELPSEPRAASGGDRLLDDGDLDVRALGELIRARQPGRPGADDDDISLGEVIQVLEVP